MKHFSIFAIVVISFYYIHGQCTQTGGFFRGWQYPYWPMIIATIFNPIVLIVLFLAGRLTWKFCKQKRMEARENPKPPKPPKPKTPSKLERFIKSIRWPVVIIVVPQKQSSEILKKTLDKHTS